MGLGATDINLIVSLQALLEEGNVTRAGERLGLGQPTMSTSLARLRRRFDDELLTRAGRGYELTPFAQELLPQVQQTVRDISRALRVDEQFRPSSSARTFRLTMSDYAIAALHGPLWAKVHAQAPNVVLKLVHLGPDVRTSGRVLLDFDVLVGPLGYDFPGESRPLWEDRMVCLVDAANPRLVNQTLSVHDLATLPHAVATFGQGNLTPVDRVLGELGVQRHVQIQVAGWLPLPAVIAGTDLVAVVPERLARLHTGAGSNLVMVEPPFGHVVLAEGYWFDPGRAADPAHRWLFDCLDQVGKALSRP